MSRWHLPGSLSLLLFFAGSCTDPAGGPRDGGADGHPSDAEADGDGDADTVDSGPPPPGESCGDVVDANASGTVDGDGVLRISGHNVGGSRDLETCEASLVAVYSADVVYSYTPDGDGLLRWTLEHLPPPPTRFDVDVRTRCEDPTSTIQCERCDGECDEPGLEVVGGEPLFFVLSGVLTTNNPEGMGAFELGFDLSPFLRDGEPCDPGSAVELCAPGLECQHEEGAALCGVCGDGFPPYGTMTCDDGNETGGDGCSETCELEVQGPGGGSCAAAAPLALVPLPPGEWGYTALAMAEGEMEAGSDLGASCAVADGPEAFYVVALAARSSVEIHIAGANVLTIRHAAPGCAGEEVACLTREATGLTIEIASLDAGEYHFILDRDVPWDGPDGHYEIEVGTVAY